MSRLSDCMQRTLDDLKLSAAHLERTAALPAMTLAHIRKGSHPRSDRFERLLTAIPGLSYRVDLLIAYIADDCPETYRPALQSLLEEQLYERLRALAGDSQDAAGTSSLQEQPAAYQAARLPLSTATRARQVLAEMAAALDAGNTQLADWLADTGQLLTAAQLPSTQAQEARIEPPSIPPMRHTTTTIAGREVTLLEPLDPASTRLNESPTIYKATTQPSQP